MRNFLLRLYLHLNGVYLDPWSRVKTHKIGRGTKIWAFTNILHGALIGRNCNICDRCFIEEDVVIGDCVTIKTGVSIWNGVNIDDDVFIGPGVQFCNDKYPRSKSYINPLHTHLKTGCSIGAGAVILPGISIGKNATIGAGSVVTKNVGDNSVVAGNPAKAIVNSNRTD